MGIRRIVVGGAAVGAVGVAGVAAGYAVAVRPLWRTWGIDPDEADLPLPGDDLVPDAMRTDTRGIDIAAPPDAVWPWLVQMGYGRAGWYSYDAMDMRGSSADRVVPDLQALSVGDEIPTSPESSFSARVVEPGRALVLFVDDDAVAEQASRARAASDAGQGPEATPANLRAAGAMMSPMGDFAASWAFVLEPRDDGRSTRLLERVRVRMAIPGKGGAVAGPLLGLGVFVMQRKQMLGIRDRVERALRPA
jgi:hypothetical protein